MEILIQVSPVFVLGSLWSGLDKRAAFLGLLVGVAGAVGLFYAGVSDVLGFHAGVVAWAVNLALCIGLSPLLRRKGGGGPPAPPPERLAA